MRDIDALIRNIPDFPKPGIQFKDITPLLLDGPAFVDVTDAIAARYEGQQVDAVVCAEAGFDGIELGSDDLLNYPIIFCLFDDLNVP